MPYIEIVAGVLVARTFNPGDLVSCGFLYEEDGCEQTKTHSPRLLVRPSQSCRCSKTSHPATEMKNIFEF